MTGTCAVCNKAVQVGGHNHGVGIPGAPLPGAIGPMRPVVPAAGPPTRTPKGNVPPGLAKYLAAKKKSGGK